MRIRTKQLLLAGFVVTALGACEAERRSGGDIPSTVETTGAAPVPAEGQLSVATDAAAPVAAEAGSEQVPVSALPDSVRTSMLIRQGTASIEVDSLDTAVAAVRALAARLGGHITNLVMQAGEERIRQATLTVRLPADRFDDALAGLAPIGDVEAVNVTTEDVGEEYVDVQMRLANARRLEERLLELLAGRTGGLNDVLTVERELARVREQIERQEGRLRYLRARVAMSTLAVTVHESGPLLARQPGQNVLVRALRQSLRNFVGLLAAVIASLGIVLPLGALAWVAWAFVRRARRGPRAAPVTGAAESSTAT